MPEVREKLRGMVERHWKKWLDTPIPALKNQSPREVAGNTSGRERLEALLSQFEQYAGSTQPFEPDTEELRWSLGMT